MILNAWRGALAALAVVAGVWLFYSARETTVPVAPSAPPATATAPDAQRVTVTLNRLNSMVTLVGFRHTNPPPWYRGNCVTFTGKTNAYSGLPPGQWRLANLHAENFNEFVRRQKIDRLEFCLLTNQVCLVTDPRVPTEWLCDFPCPACFSEATRHRLKQQYAGYFSRHPLEAQLPRHRWILTQRNDPDGLCAQVLPGEILQFIGGQIACLASNGAPRGTRAWEPGGEPPDFYLAARETFTNNVYTGATFKVTVNPDRLRLVPTSKNRGDGGSAMGEVYFGQASAEYRAEPTPPAPK